MNDYIQPVTAYLATIILAHVAQRYHLTGEQTTAIMADVGTAATFALGLVSHRHALMKEPPK
jgi:hypothetical protein